MNFTTTYEIHLNGSLVDSSPLAGIAFLKFQSAKLLGQATLIRIESHNDLVLGNRFIYDDSLGGWDKVPPVPREECPHRIEEEDRKLQKNALRIETMAFAPRCLLKLPEHWASGAKQLGALRWIGSGGSALVFGECNRHCPKHQVCA